MILLAIKEYIKTHKWVSLQHLALYFQRDPDTMRQMLGHWLRKGVICKTLKSASCGVQCSACQPSVTEMYFWSDIKSASL